MSLAQVGSKLAAALFSVGAWSVISKILDNMGGVLSRTQGSQLEIDPSSILLEDKEIWTIQVVEAFLPCLLKALAEAVEAKGLGSSQIITTLCVVRIIRCLNWVLFECNTWIYTSLIMLEIIPGKHQLSDLLLVINKVRGLVPLALQLMHSESKEERKSAIRKLLPPLIACDSLDGERHKKIMQEMLFVVTDIEWSSRS